uniref:LRRCT domain-containing protein n=1 Tax=Caenorhabditis tropicalis TaxID=1561998 RepID=A0A1I7UHF7_9PELO
MLLDQGLGSMPIEMVTRIVQWLNPTDKLNTALSHIGIAGIIVNLLPRIRALRIGVSSDDLKGKIEGDTADITAPRISEDERRAILNLLMPYLVETIESLHLENELINEEISDEQLATFLQFTRNSPLRELVLTEIDLEHIHTWTLALFARFTNLEKVEIDGCKLGNSTEASLLRSLSSSFQTLTQIDLKGTPQITDQFSRRISRSCPNLSYFRISGCPLVTTLSALPLIESTAMRRTDKLDVHMDNTDFDANQLQSFMRSPLFGSSSSEWSLESVTVPLGYNKPAVLALHSSRKYVLIFV